jgi:hypothetical protein
MTTRDLALTKLGPSSIFAPPPYHLQPTLATAISQAQAM